MPPAPITASAPPPTLGQVALQRNETLWRLIVKVYGTYDQTYLDRLKQANPGLEEPKRIVAGRLISIPAIPLTIEPAKGSHWLKLWDSATLADAIQLLRTYPAKAPPIRIVPYWDGRKLSFPIVLRELFTDEKSAIERASLLPAEIGGPATVLSSWGTGAVFYANPNLKQKG